jgi:hypothetical protein
MKIISANIYHYSQNALEKIMEEKQVATVALVFTALLEFVFQSFQIDIFLFFFLILMVGVNTYSGVRLAKQKKTFNLKILKESVMGKFIGYLILLIALSIFIMVLFVASLRDQTRLVSDYWLNVPMILLLVFLSSIEFKSVLQNLEELGINVPLFVKKIPSQIIDKIDTITDLNNDKND